MADIVIGLLGAVGATVIILGVIIFTGDKLSERKRTKIKKKDIERQQLITDIANHVEGRMRKVLREQDKIIGRCEVITKE